MRILGKNVCLDEAEGQDMMANDRRSERDLETICALLHLVAGDHAGVQQEGVDGVTTPDELIGCRVGGLDARNVDRQGFEGVDSQPFGKRLFRRLGLVESAAG